MNLIASTQSLQAILSAPAATTNPCFMVSYHSPSGGVGVKTGAAATGITNVAGFAHFSRRHLD